MIRQTFGLAYEKTCKDCGKAFTAHGRTALRCPECAVKAKKARQKQWREEHKKAATH